MNPSTSDALQRLYLVAAAESVRQTTEFLNGSVAEEAAIKGELLVQMGRIAELPQGSRFMAYFAEEARMSSKSTSQHARLAQEFLLAFIISTTEQDGYCRVVTIVPK